MTHLIISGSHRALQLGLTLLKLILDLKNNVTEGIAIVVGVIDVRVGKLFVHLK